MSTSDSSFCSDSEDSEDKRRKREEKTKRARKKARREEHEAKAAAKAEKAATKAKAVALDIIAKIPYAVEDHINSYASGGGGDDDDDDEEEDMVMENVLEMISRKPAGAPEEVVDMSNWTTADKYVRKEFKVHQSIEKIAFLMQYFDPSDNTTPKL